MGTVRFKWLNGEISKKLSCSFKGHTHDAIVPTSLLTSLETNDIHGLGTLLLFGIGLLCLIFHRRSFTRTADRRFRFIDQGRRFFCRRKKRKFSKVLGSDLEANLLSLCTALGAWDAFDCCFRSVSPKVLNCCNLSTIKWEHFGAWAKGERTVGWLATDFLYLRGSTRLLHLNKQEPSMFERTVTGSEKKHTDRFYESRNVSNMRMIQTFLLQDGSRQRRVQWKGWKVFMHWTSKRWRKTSFMHCVRQLLTRRQLVYLLRAGRWCQICSCLHFLGSDWLKRDECVRTAVWVQRESMETLPVSVDFDCVSTKMTALIREHSSCWTESFFLWRSFSRYRHRRHCLRLFFPGNFQETVE